VYHVATQKQLLTYDLRRRTNNGEILLPARFDPRNDRVIGLAADPECIQVIMNRTATGQTIYLGYDRRTARWSFADLSDHSGDGILYAHTWEGGTWSTLQWNAPERWIIRRFVVRE
jgi:hypothetical protein